MDGSKCQVNVKRKVIIYLEMTLLRKDHPNETYFCPR